MDAGGDGAGLKSGKKRTKRRSFDNLADEKSKAREYSDNGLNTFKDSHIHKAFCEALKESSKLQNAGSAGFDPIKHERMVKGEFQSFSDHAIMAPSTN